MKRLSLLKKIALGSGAIAAITPIALMTTSCAIEDITADYIEFNSIYNEGTYDKVHVASTPFKRLLFGSKKVFNGNYILLIGSSMFDSTAKFYSGNARYRSRQQWFKTSEQTEEGHFWDGDFYLGIAKTAGKAKNFGIFNVIDFWDGKVYDKKNHEITVCSQPDVPLTNIGPWTKWTKEIINQTRMYNKSHNYDWDEKSVTDKEYIRNDASAVAFRTFINTGLQVYPTNDKRKKSFNVSDGNTEGKMLVFVDGKLQSQGKDEKELIDILDFPSSATSWYDTIMKYFPEKKEN